MWVGEKVRFLLFDLLQFLFYFGKIGVAVVRNIGFVVTFRVVMWIRYFHVYYYCCIFGQLGATVSYRMDIGIFYRRMLITELR